MALSAFFLLLLLLLPCNTVAHPDPNDTRQTPPPQPPPPSSSFKPGMAVVVGVLTTMFSLTFLLLLYIKHCNGATSHPAATSYSGSRAAAATPFSGRKNSGIDRSIVESLPIFRFGSLRGQKEGLDCAVCLNKFESPEVLRLLPKCKHAFHVECVDTWLDAHSMCPLCRHRVDPEDILLVDAVPGNENHQNESESASSTQLVSETRRVSGRHSSVGEKEGGFLEIILENSESECCRNGASLRRSLDSASSKSKSMKERVGWLVRGRKDGMLLVTQDAEKERERERERERSRESAERRLEHRIIVSPSTKQCGYGGVQRWSDVQPSDLLYLTSEMIMSGRRNKVALRWNTRVRNNNNDGGGGGGGGREESRVINTRSVSEMTGLSRFREEGEEQEEEEEEGVVSRWLGWISRTQTMPAVR